MRPPLKWAGGKRWQVPHLAPLWAAAGPRRLVEPFCGGLAVALGLSPDRALLNDANTHLINFYRWIQRGLVTSIDMRNDRALYDRHRTRFNRLLECGEGEGAEAAALFYFLNRTGFNGLCRFNRSGAFNVPFGRYTRIAYTRDFGAYADALRRWTFSDGDFAALPIEPSDFIYADPPYDVAFRSYEKVGFSWGDQVRVATWLSRHEGPVVLVNQATSRIVDLYRSLDYALTFIEGPRRISCDGDRTPAQEVIATRHVVPKREGSR